MNECRDGFFFLLYLIFLVWSLSVWLGDLVEGFFFSGSQDHGFNLLRRVFLFVKNIVCVLLSVGVGRTFSLSLSLSLY